MRRPSGGGRPVVCGPGFLLPFGYRHSLLGSSWPLGIEPPSRSAYRPPPVTGPQRGCRVAHEQAATGQGALFIRGRWCAPGRRVAFGRRSPLFHGQSLRPRWNIPSAGGTFTRRQREFTLFTHHPRPGSATGPGPGTRTHTGPRRSSPRPRPPDGTRAASASAPGSAPRSYPRRTPGRRRANTHWPGYYAPGLSRASNGASPLNSCTLTSHAVPCSFRSGVRRLPGL